MLAAAQAGDSTLLIAPTGGGKTLAGFLPSLIDLHAAPRAGLHTLYISPLKALAVDIARNLMAPVAEMEYSSPRDGSKARSVSPGTARRPAKRLVPA